MGVISTQGIKYQLVANGVILDLYQDEIITLSNNSTQLFDLGQLPAEYTKQLTLPGSKKNNAFFEHVYDISIVNPYLFSTNVKVPCYISYGGIYLSQGYLQLNKVNLYQNKFVDSYEVSIYGALSSFARETNKTFLTDMTSSLSYLNHSASFDNITGSWDLQLFSGSVVYPFCEYGQKLQYTPDLPLLGINSPSGGLYVQDYKPAVRIRDVWNAIFDQYGFTYSSSFWQQSWLDNVYLLANNQLRYPVFSGSFENPSQSIDLEGYGLGKISPVSGSTDTVLTAGVAKALPWTNIQTNPYGNFDSNLVYHLDFPSRLTYNFQLQFEVSKSGAGYGEPIFNFNVLDGYSNSVVSSVPLTSFNDYMNGIKAYDISQGNGTGTKTYTLVQQGSTDYLPSGSYKFGITYNNSGGSNFKLTIDKGGQLSSYLDIIKAGNVGEGFSMNIGGNLPYGTRGIKQIEFITAIQKKFNLVIYPSKTKINEFIVEPFNTWYNKGTTWDFNKYVNLNDKISVTPTNNLAVNTLTFADTLDNDYVSQQFYKGINREFGKVYYVDTQNFFSQGNFDVKTTLASSPIIYLSGTGVSGSAQSGGPVATSIGYPYHLSYSTGQPLTACNAQEGPYELFSSTGILEPSTVLYFDAYGNNPVVGFNYLIDNNNSCDIWSINTLGIVNGGTPYRCTYCV